MLYEQVVNSQVIYIYICWSAAFPDKQAFELILPGAPRTSEPADEHEAGNQRTRRSNIGCCSLII